MASTPSQRGKDGSGSVFGMSKPVFISVFLHLIVIVLAIVGLPYISRAPETIDTPIPVEVATIAEKSQVNKPAASPQVAPKKEDKKDPPKPVPPTNTSREPPKPSPPKPPEPVKSESKPVPADDALAPPDKTLKKVEKQAKKPDKPVLTDTKKDEDSDAQMDALLKNLIKNEPSAAQPDAPEKEGDPTPNADQGDQVTANEMDAVRQQLGDCWKLLAGARYASDLAVEIRLTMGPDKRVISADIVDQARYNNDSFFRAAADSAQRAVYDPHCNPLDKLPDGKYDKWKDMIINFDPKEMLQ